MRRSITLEKYMHTFIYLSEIFKIVYNLNQSTRILSSRPDWTDACTNAHR